MNELSTGLAATAAVVFCLLMVALALFQAALLAGAPLGHLAWGGQDRVLPTRKRIGSAVSILVYAVFALIVLERADLVAILPWPDVVAVATWVIAGYFVLGIAVNGISRSRAERWTMTPLCAVLATLVIVVALS